MPVGNTSIINNFSDTTALYLEFPKSGDFEYYSPQMLNFINNGIIFGGALVSGEISPTNKRYINGVKYSFKINDNRLSITNLSDSQDILRVYIGKKNTSVPKKYIPKNVQLNSEFVQKNNKLTLNGPNYGSTIIDINNGESANLNLNSIKSFILQYIDTPNNCYDSKYYSPELLR